MRIIIPMQVIDLTLVYVVPISVVGISSRSSNARTAANTAKIRSKNMSNCKHLTEMRSLRM